MDSEKERVASSLRGLVARTAKGKVKWIESESDGFYTDSMGIRIWIDAREGSFEGEDYVISFYSLPENSQIFEFTDVDLKDVLQNSFLVMRGLYQQARLMARGYRDKLDQVLDDLIKDDPDHIPF